jgi:hypothetical protein
MEQGTTQMTQTILTASAAEANLRSQSQRELYELCQEAHKDVEGVRGRHMAAYTVDELVSWWMSVYQWDDTVQAWVWSDTVRQRMEAAELEYEKHYGS